MWERSNRPAEVRVCECSARMPSYWSGISQPPNGTILAPAASCKAVRGVRSRSSVKRSVAVQVQVDGTRRDGFVERVEMDAGSAAGQQSLTLFGRPIDPNLNHQAVILPDAIQALL